MNSRLRSVLKYALTVRWRPGRDLLAVAVSWVLLVASLYTASFVIGAEAAGGMGYFGMYAVVGALLVGTGIPLYWTAVVRGRPLSDLGLTRRRLRLSLLLQLVFAAVLFVVMPAAPSMSWERLLPLIALALAIGLFEAVFWRGWVLQRLEDAFGVIPAILLGSLLYAAYHIGYGMNVDEMEFLFFIGIMFALVFLTTRSVFVLWPLFQPMGQLITLVRDGLELPVLASLGFIDILALMATLVWLAARYLRKHGIAPAENR
jgi:hypothetical protein